MIPQINRRILAFLLVLFIVVLPYSKWFLIVGTKGVDQKGPGMSAVWSSMVFLVHIR